MPSDSAFPKRVEEFEKRIASWRKHLDENPYAPEQAALELNTATEELNTATEEMRQQNESLLETQAALEAERERYFELFQSAPDGYVITDEKGAIYEANDAAGRLLGVLPAFLTGKPLLRFFHTDDVRTARHQMTMLQQTHRPLEWKGRVVPRAAPSFFAAISVGEVTQLVQGTRRRWLRWVLRDASHQVELESQALALAEDMEELKARQEAAEQSNRTLRAGLERLEEANKAKDRFLALLSHELRNSMSPALMHVEDLLLQEQPPKTWSETLQAIRGSLLTQRRLIDDLLDMTRIIHGKLELQPEVVNLQALLNDVLTGAREAIAAQQLTLHVKTEEEELQVHADPTRLRQIFWNLLNNAIKFTPPKGQLFVRMGRKKGQAEEVAVEVQDTGPGIPQESLASIFNAFEQTASRFARSRGGLGLGLWIARSLAEAHGGTVEAFSEGLGKGATFRVRLPRYVLAEQPAVRTSQRRGISPKLRILLVEDHAATLQAMSQLLGHLGHEVTAAMSVEEALQQAASREFDLLLSDLYLPDGMGADILTRHHEGHVRSAAILSGGGTSDEFVRCQRAGFEYQLRKPVSIEELNGLLSRLSRA